MLDWYFFLCQKKSYVSFRHYLHFYTYKCISSIYFLFNRLNSLTRWHGYYLCGIRVHLLILETQNVCFRQYKPSPIQHIWLVIKRKTPKVIFWAYLHIRACETYFLQSLIYLDYFSKKPSLMMSEVLKLTWFPFSSIIG